MSSLLALVVIAIFLVTSACTRLINIKAEKAKVKMAVDKFAQMWETEGEEAQPGGAS